MYEAETRAFISLATLCLVTNPPCREEDWQYTPEADLFDAMIEDMPIAEARQLLSFVIGVAIGLLEDSMATQGMSALDYLRMRGLQVAQQE